EPNAVRPAGAWDGHTWSQPFVALVGVVVSRCRITVRPFGSCSVSASTRTCCAAAGEVGTATARTASAPVRTRIDRGMDDTPGGRLSVGGIIGPSAECAIPPSLLPRVHRAEPAGPQGGRRNGQDDRQADGRGGEQGTWSRPRSVAFGHGPTNRWVSGHSDVPFEARAFPNAEWRPNCAQVSPCAAGAGHP